MVGWALILEYTIGGAAVARGISPNLVTIRSFSYVAISIRIYCTLCNNINLEFDFIYSQEMLFGGPNSLPLFLARQTIPGVGIVVDPCAAILVFMVTALLCVGIKEVPFYSVPFLR